MNDILLINGPNLGILGRREPAIYGHVTLADVVGRLGAMACDQNFNLISFQNNSEGNIIDFIEAHHNTVGMVINPGALMIAGWSLFDALKAYPGLMYEVHISNVWARESFRHTSMISPLVSGVICGCGVHGYTLALDALMYDAQCQSERESDHVTQ